jgi:hypothetical protein
MRLSSLCVTLIAARKERDMNSTIYPIENLPAGYKGRIEVTDIPAERDERDEIMGGMALVGVGFLVLPAVVSLNLLGIAVGAAVLLYVYTAMRRLRIYTGSDVRAFRAIVKPEKSAEPAYEEGDLDLILLDPLPDTLGDDGNAGVAAKATE